MTSCTTYLIFNIAFTTVDGGFFGSGSGKVYSLDSTAAQQGKTLARKVENCGPEDDVGLFCLGTN